jgi:NAD-dependent deacetylase
MRSVTNAKLISEIQGDINVGDLAADGGQLRPHIVWFDELVPMIETALEVMPTADIFVVIGTSLLVYPAASLIHYAPANVPKYIIDRSIPSTGNITNMTVIEKPATEGVKEFQSLLARGFNS